jgi:hypothetical protein
MPTLESRAYPDARVVVMDMLADVDSEAFVRATVPQDFEAATTKLVVVRRVGGSPDEDDVTDRPIVQVACYAPTYLAAAELAQGCQTRILTSPCTLVGDVLVDEARLFVGDQEVPDVYPDDRRIVSTYQLGWRRQFQP